MSDLFDVLAHSLIPRICVDETTLTDHVHVTALAHSTHVYAGQEEIQLTLLLEPCELAHVYDTLRTVTTDAHAFSFQLPPPHATVSLYGTLHAWKLTGRWLELCVRYPLRSLEHRRLPYRGTP